MRLVRGITAAWRFFKRPRVFDITFIAVMDAVAAFAGISAQLQGATSVAVNALWFVVATLPLLARRNRPILVAVATVAIDVTGLATGVSTVMGFPAMVAIYSVGRYTPGRVAAMATACGAVVYGAAYELFQQQGAWLGGALAPVGIVIIGQFVRVRAELRLRERQQAADSAVRAERRRIARELHDVVAHHLSVINALVGGARATLPPGEEVAHDALAGAERTARQALAEMRQLLDVLRADDTPAVGEGHADAATGVGAARLPALVQEAESAGLPASLTVTGEAVTLPAAVDHAVYRVVQEALTNTRKHASGARASVRLAYEERAVEVEVLDDGVPGLPSRAEPGFGLGGMAERVALCGGQLRTGPRVEGGFVVHARIPLERTS
ncbi:sensor histidine kinase [Nonomuraea rhizosphaerae]|uniref:sensor histidine kinase n=1 Tax=Nonomuraea rhizosphaerae TaxID=2665663 RepID=UPI001C5D4B2C|nr:histidine kinase [Nonomuraea rhizosphaerae]